MVKEHVAQALLWKTARIVKDPNTDMRWKIRPRAIACMLQRTLRGHTRCTPRNIRGEPRAPWMQSLWSSTTRSTSRRDQSILMGSMSISR
jgi:hypothetical protein